MLITVFTPAFNRAGLLPRLYESLCRQTFRDFEWVVVDDGSTDKTGDLTQSLLQREEAFFSIRYFYQENGGKHRAVNHGVREAKGELFFIADSDDMLPPDALETVAKVYEGIMDDKSFAGVCGLDATFDGCIIGTGLPDDVVDDTAIVVRFKMGVRGDMKEVYRTSVLKEYTFPEIEGERFCPEMLLWNRIASKYKLRFINQVVYLAEYQTDGISAGIVRARMNSPVASMMTYAELMRYNVPFKVKMKSAVNYWRFWFCSKKEKGVMVSKWYLWLLPIGFLMHIRDINK